MKCLECNLETNNPKFCGRSCAAKYNNKKTPKRKSKKKCSLCDNYVKNWRTTLCIFHHTEYIQNRFEYIKEKTLGEYWEKDSLKNLPKSSKNAHLRLLARSHFKHLLILPCNNCGYDKHVELCHIKPISSFVDTDKVKDVNCEENLIQLCPNCHWEFDSGLINISK